MKSKKSRCFEAAPRMCSCSPTYSDAIVECLPISRPPANGALDSQLHTGPTCPVTCTKNGSTSDISMWIALEQQWWFVRRQRSVRHRLLIRKLRIYRDRHPGSSAFHTKQRQNKGLWCYPDAPGNTSPCFAGAGRRRPMVCLNLLSWVGVEFQLGRIGFINQGGRGLFLDPRSLGNVFFLRLSLVPGTDIKSARLTFCTSM